MSFCSKMMKTGSSWFNLINLMNWEVFEILGLETTRIGDFVQLSYLVKLACVIDSLCHYILLSNLCNDKLINLLGFFFSMGFQNLGFFFWL